MTPPQLVVTEVDHINQLVGSADLAVEHYERVLGVAVEEVFRQRTGPYDNFIVKVGTMTLEVFAPVDPGFSFGKQHARFGNCWQGCLWRVPDLVGAVDTCRARGIPVVDVNLERGWAFTDPRATYFSIQLEDKDDWDKSTTSNGAGITGLHGFTAAVADGPAAVIFFRDLLSGVEVRYEEDRPALGARAVGLGLAGYELELQWPTGDGVVASFLDRYRQRIRTATWTVASIDRLAARLAGEGITLRDGDRDGTVAIAPEDNLGVAMQFVEAVQPSS